MESPTSSFDRFLNALEMTVLLAMFSAVTLPALQDWQKEREQRLQYTQKQIVQTQGWRKAN